MLIAARTNRSSFSPFLFVGRSRPAVLYWSRPLTRSGDGRRAPALVANPLRWRLSARLQAVWSGHHHVLRRSGGWHLALRRRDKSDAQRLGKVADPGEEPGGVRRAVELQAREVVMMHPFVQQGLEKDLWREHLLADGGQV